LLGPSLTKKYAAISNLLYQLKQTEWTNDANRTAIGRFQFRVVSSRYGKDSDRRRIDALQRETEAAIGQALSLPVGDANDYLPKSSNKK